MVPPTGFQVLGISCVPRPCVTTRQCADEQIDHVLAGTGEMLSDAPCAAVPRALERVRFFAMGTRITQLGLARKIARLLLGTMLHMPLWECGFIDLPDISLSSVSKDDETPGKDDFVLGVLIEDVEVPFDDVMFRWQTWVISCHP